MMKSTRIQLLIMIFAAVLPALGIIIYSNYERQQHDMDMARAGAQAVLQGLANDHGNVVEVTRRFLMTLARLPALQDRDVSECNSLFRELLKDNAQYATIYAADSEGTVFANALPSSRISIRERNYFQDALQTRSLSVGRYVIGPVSRRSVLPFAYPIVNSRGHVIGVVAVSLDLEKYGKNFLAMMKLPQNSTLNLLDYNHIRLFRYPDSEKYAGKADSPEIVEQTSAGPPEGAFTAVGVDGVRRLFAYKRFSLNADAAPYFYMRVGIPEQQILAPARTTFRRNMGLLVGSLIAALLIAWFLGNTLIVKRLNRLVEASHQVQRGDLSARTAIDYTEGELGRLARSFDEMAEALEAKEAARKRAELEREEFISELQAANSRVKTLSGLLPICAWCKKVRDDKGYWNQIEAYIRDNTEAEFSHGICPDCRDRLHPKKSHSE